VEIHQLLTESADKVYVHSDILIPSQSGFSMTVIQDVRTLQHNVLPFHRQVTAISSPAQYFLQVMIKKMTASQNSNFLCLLQYAIQLDKYKIQQFQLQNVMFLGPIIAIC
jgi:hypothetical protein